MFAINFMLTAAGTYRCSDNG